MRQFFKVTDEKLNNIGFVYTPQSYGMSLAIWDHTVLPATWQVNVPRLTPARKAGTQLTLTYPKGMEGWIDVGGWLHTDASAHRQSPIQVLTGPGVE